MRGARRLIDNGRFNVTPLQVAARAGHLEVVTVLLAAGANVNHFDHDDFSPVTSAARAGKWGVVRVLAEHGGDFHNCDGHGVGERLPAALPGQAQPCRDRGRPRTAGIESGQQQPVALKRA